MGRAAAKVNPSGVVPRIALEVSMANAQELKAKYWHEFKEHPVIMVGLVAEAGVSRPMTAQFQDGSESWWFFTTKAGEFFARFTEDHHAFASYVAKDQRLFASVLGRLTLEADRHMIDQLWNRSIEPWFDGKDDPKLALLRFDGASAEVWLHETGLLTGVKLLLGANPKQEYAQQVAKLSL